MPRSSRLRRRPSTPNLNQHLGVFTADPASPPETPTTSPQFSRKSSLKPRHQNDPYLVFSPTLANDPRIKPVGNGHQFSYQPALGPEQLSPRSSSSSSVSDDVSEEGDSSEDDDDDDASFGSLPNAPTAPQSPFVAQSRYSAFLTRQSESVSDGSEEEDSDDELHAEIEDDEDEDEDDDVEQSRIRNAPLNGDWPPGIPTIGTATLWDFVFEEVDPMEQALDGALNVLYPYEVESDGSRSRSRRRASKGLDRSMMREFKKMNCSNEPSSDDEPDFDLNEEIFLKRQQEMRRLRRVSMSSSVGKRTHSELSDNSDDDFGPCDVSDIGSSARRFRKRLHRGSLIFNDPPEQIEELDEPDSSEDEFQAGQSLAQELPYWTMEIIELENS